MGDDTDLRGAKPQQARGEEGRFTPPPGAWVIKSSGGKPSFLTCLITTQRLMEPFGPHGE